MAENREREREIPIIFSSDDNYAPYLCVAIKSLIEHSSENKCYSIVVLDGGISEVKKKKISLLETSNISISFLNMTSYIDKLDKNIFYTHTHFTISNYFRFFIPVIFENYKKVLYCDCDAIFLDDAAKLFDIDTKNFLFCAAKDIAFQRYIYTENKYYHNYCYSILKMHNPFNYINSGIMLMNIEELIKFDFFNKCINKLKEIKTPICVDQCIINSLCEGKIKFLDLSWNAANQMLLIDYNLREELPPDIFEQYSNAIKEPKYLHYTSDIKPWINPQIPNAEIFWKYARKTPFYEEILFKNIINVKNNIVKIKYKNFFQRIFSIKNISYNEKKYKVITILGIKIKNKKN